MILSERELELGTDHAGIIVLADGPEPGTPLADVMPLTEQVLDATPTMNRVDLLSMVGLAREVAALCDGELLPIDVEDPPIVHPEWVEVTVEDAVGCPRYIGRVFKDVQVGPSPLWLRARLHAAGDARDLERRRHHELRHARLRLPLHVFDRSLLAGGRIVVRRARAARSCGRSTALCAGSTERPADHRRREGGRARRDHGRAESEVSEATTEVLLEAANFEPIGVLQTSERLGLRTAGSNRWEKGVDPHMAEPAAVLASRLIVDLAGAELVGGVDVHSGLPERPVVRLRPERTERVVGLEVDEAEQRAILERLDFEVDDDWNVTVPTWRARDVTREIDLVEEVARVVLDRVPHTMPLRRAVAGHLTQDQRLRRLVEDVLVGAGFSEAFTWSLVADRSDPDAIRVPDPLTADQAILRTTLLEGLIQAARVNVDAGNQPIALFELARVYLPSGEQLPEERWRVGGIAEGGFGRRAARVEALYAALHLELRAERADAAVPPSGQGRDDRRRLARRAPSGAARGGWGVFELDLRRSSAPCPSASSTRT